MVWAVEIAGIFIVFLSNAPGNLKAGSRQRSIGQASPMMTMRSLLRYPLIHELALVRPINYVSLVLPLDRRRTLGVTVCMKQG
jgi:hypothetical protein